MAGVNPYIKKPVAVKVLHPQFARYQEAIHRFLRGFHGALVVDQRQALPLRILEVQHAAAVHHRDGRSAYTLLRKARAPPIQRPVRRGVPQHQHRLSRTGAEDALAGL